MKKIYKKITYLSSRGFSLLELTISLGVFAIIIMMVSNIVILNLRISIINRARTRAREESGFVLKQLKRDIRNSSRIKVVQGGAASDILVIETDSLDTSSNQIFCWVLGAPDSEGDRQVEKYEADTGALDFDSLASCGPQSAEFELVTKMPGNIDVITWDLGEPRSVDNNTLQTNEVKQIIIQLDTQMDLPIADNAEFRNSILVRKQTIIATRNFIVERY